VILESTTYPGTTEEVVLPILEKSGFSAGVDFSLAFSPERIDPGNPKYGITNTPKIVGGVTASCTDRAATFYQRFVETVIRAKGTREAEMAKLLENTYRHVNIALVNEMAQFSKDLDIDFWNVIECASSKPFGFQAFRPGPGVGGHCIPIDPNYLSHTVKSRLGHAFRFVELAQEINAGMPAYVAARIQDLLNEAGKPVKGSRILLLGITYKANIADARESPSMPLALVLRAKGALVEYHDPLVKSWTINGVTQDCVPDLDTAVGSSEIVVLLQAHSGYDLHSLEAGAPIFFDTRGVTNTPGTHRL
jgi:UDP-N-acetyl-D-glucosamine dehydrogenase